MSDFYTTTRHKPALKPTRLWRGLIPKKLAPHRVQALGLFLIIT
ncbi:hypothetical protein AO385_0940 [Moraxella catarrhalis]|uniref:Uncharacterized protein n=1 Tax=Moraxella catarrhalis TaxID=480 RepID=A0A198UJP2_MORCA|nr:hypothetical protein AO384_1386 [Moraxella catarrhalis]OAU99575.1 hypothetical protein AO383_0169 [Moraxella catarrhalis]OAV02579.1 hypothetical protein AO385_0940 [Moraxella catarrhalis]